MISGDPKRADIIVAGGLVLHEVMAEVGLDYLFVSKRGLRDGLMVDLLQRQYSDSGAWHPDADRSESLEQVCQKYSNDMAHSQHVSQLALNLFYQLQKLHKLPERIREHFARCGHASRYRHGDRRIETPQAFLLSDQKFRDEILQQVGSGACRKYRALPPQSSSEPEASRL